MLRTLGIAGLVWTCCGVGSAAASAPIWVVQEGDALSIIAERFGVTVEELKAWNGLEGDVIRIGDSLVVGEQAELSGTGNAPKLGLAEPKDEGIDWTPPFDYGARVEDAFDGEQSEPLAARDPSVALPKPAIPKEDAGQVAAKRRTYRVQAGDTLLGIAARFDTSLDELRAANPGLDPDRIFPGDTLKLSAPRPEVFVEWERGDTLLAASQRYDVNVRDLLRWNPGISRHGPKPGDRIRVHTRAPVSPSEAIGLPNRGRLEQPVPLPRHVGYVIRDPARSYGTEESVRWIVEAFDRVDAKFPPKKVRVHDISDRNGGWLRDHKSHQNGRDADISYYQQHCGSKGCPFQPVKATDLDVARQWALLEHWLRHGQAELIFIDYRLQAKLYRHAKKQGASEDQLSRWFQYPRGRHEPKGIVRHYQNHQDHLHVRFVCPYSDEKCR